jgi:hypothetical protein
MSQTGMYGANVREMLVTVRYRKEGKEMSKE